jgi:hypothetical protein
VDAVVIGEEDSHGASFSHEACVEASGFSPEKVIRATFGCYCGSGPSCGQPSALQMIGEN